MSRPFRVTVAILAALTLGAACAGDRATAPDAGRAVSAPATSEVVRLAGGSTKDEQPDAPLVSCTKRVAVADSLLIGPRGGILTFGGNQLIVPPGALTKPVMISGRIVADANILLVHFEPSGLQFRKPAGLVLDAQGCTIPDGSVPDVVYVEHGRVLERITATFNRAWKAVAAPVEHFSGYSIAL